MKYIFQLCIFLFLVSQSSFIQANENTFVETSEEIINQLTDQNKFGLTRSFNVAEEKTRSITILIVDEDIEKKKNVQVKKKTPGTARIKVEFGEDSSTLRPESYGVLDQLGVALFDSRVANNQLCIKGHTDSDGSNEYNLELSYDRAKSVKNYIAANHNPQNIEMFIAGFGEQLPIVENDSLFHKQMNRRVEVTLGCPEISK